MGRIFFFRLIKYRSHIFPLLIEVIKTQFVQFLFNFAHYFDVLSDRDVIVCDSSWGKTKPSSEMQDCKMSRKKRETETETVTLADVTSTWRDSLRLACTNPTWTLLCIHWWKHSI